MDAEVTEVAGALVVYGDAAIAQILTTIFAVIYGFRARAVTTPEAALQQLPPFAPDIVLVDEGTVDSEMLAKLRGSVRRRPFTILYSNDVHTKRRAEADACITMLASWDLDRALVPWMRGKSR